ncbi:hypothetical protein D3C81_1662860 [compost metagenome]
MLRNEKCGMPGTRPMTAIKPAATASALGEANIWRLICLPMSSEPDARVTMIAAAVDNNSDGNCATKPSPMVSSAYTLPASPKVMPCWKIPTAMPPIRLMNRINRPAMASPRTNLLAPSMEP